MSDLMGQLGFVSDHMPIIRGIGQRFVAGQPFDGLTVAVRIHVEPKTAVLVRTLRDGGARVIALGNKGTTTSSPSFSDKRASRFWASVPTMTQPSWPTSPHSLRPRLMSSSTTALSL